jgi:hypothetical protein
MLSRVALRESRTYRQFLFGPTNQPNIDLRSTSQLHYGQARIKYSSASRAVVGKLATTVLLHCGARCYRSETQSGTEADVAESNERDDLANYVAKELRDENLWTKLWSLLYHGFVFSASILSALAALTLQLKSVNWEPSLRADIAAGLAGIASLVGVISVSGGFGQKWRANRLTKGTPDCDLSKVRVQLIEMKRVHHLAILGDGQLPKSPKS